jgi:hypothetical protein
MIVHVAFRSGGAWHSRGVTTVRDCGDRLEIARLSESPVVFRSGRISSVVVDLEVAAVAPYEGSPDAA